MGKEVKKLMIQGTMSGVGKSILTALFCYAFSQKGLKVRPFKSQNMSTISHTTKGGDIMALAQAIQAKACGVPPHPDMNPLLMVPIGDKKSKIYLRGKYLGEFNTQEFYKNRPSYIPEIINAADSLMEEADMLAIEGAGGTAEINLRKDDVVNMGLAHMLDAPVILVGDIEPGGVFAQLYGSYMLLDEADRKRIKGFIINKFRGDESILLPGIQKLEELTKVKVLGVLPWMDVRLPDEDSFKGAGKKPAPSTDVVEEADFYHEFSALTETDKFKNLLASVQDAIADH